MLVGSPADDWLKQYLLMAVQIFLRRLRAVQEKPGFLQTQKGRGIWNWKTHLLGTIPFPNLEQSVYEAI